MRASSEQPRKRKATDEDTLTDNNPRLPASNPNGRMSVTPAPFEPASSLSSSHNRQTLAATGTMQDEEIDLPNINFGFDDLRDRMARFSAKFDAFIEQGRKHVLEERNEFRIKMAELQGTAN
jgi:hypothetical protein